MAFNLDAELMGLQQVMFEVKMSVLSQKRNVGVRLSVRQKSWLSIQGRSAIIACMTGPKHLFQASSLKWLANTRRSLSITFPRN